MVIFGDFVSWLVLRLADDSIHCRRIDTREIGRYYMYYTLAFVADGLTFTNMSGILMATLSLGLSLPQSSLWWPEKAPRKGDAGAAG